VISFQLGSGCSVAAIDRGAPKDTSMGFSPLEGLVMATRAGDLDPGLIAYLQRREALSPDAIEGILSRECGLLGVAGEADMRRLLDRKDADARLAVELYCYRARKYLGAYLAALGGADAVLFGGGVGENAPVIRARILENMEWAGIVLDDAANSAPGTESRISAPGAKVDVRVVRVDEARILAEEASRLLSGDRARTSYERVER
jgi:acetate kinase